MTPLALVAVLIELTGAPETKTLRVRAERLAPVLVEAAASVDPPLPPDLLGAIAFTESGYDHRTVGALGEVGTMQILPDGLGKILCRGLNVRGLRGNVRCGARILSHVRARCGGEPLRWISAYSGQKCGNSAYARRVLRLLQRGR